MTTAVLEARPTPEDAAAVPDAAPSAEPPAVVKATAPVVASSDARAIPAMVAAGEWIRAQRRGRWWTQHQLAAELTWLPGLPVDVDQVLAWERGVRPVPADVAARLRRLFGEASSAC